ncbi:MAG TPA: lysylphosphatidylglycerol synthase transmembrane domain-containing protein [Vicinamibacterales bacterium]|nr:lysylphosphatidylglycerol synthase transmembrane domain-containing protein [Vicinamibacterales bacterium]
MPRALKILIAVVLTALVLYWSSPSAILAAAAAMDWRWLGAAVGLVFVDRTLMALRWIDLLVALAPGTRPPLRTVLRVFFLSSFVSNFIPSVGADLYRAYALSRYDVHLAESTASVLMDRALGVLSVVVVAAAALPFATVEGTRDLVLLLAAMAAVCAVAAAVVFSERAAAIVRAAAGLVPIALLHRVTAALTDAVRAYATHHRAVARVLALSIAVQAFRVLQAWCLGRGLGLDLALTTYFAFIPLIVFIMQVPVTPNGLGTTQLAFDRFLVPQGAPRPEVFALSMLFLGLGFIGTLPGAVLYAFAPAGARAGTRG